MCVCVLRVRDVENNSAVNVYNKSYRSAGMYTSQHERETHLPWHANYVCKKTASVQDEKELRERLKVLGGRACSFGLFWNPKP